MGTDTRRLRQPVEADSCIAANRLACYVSALRERDDTRWTKPVLTLWAPGGSVIECGPCGAV